MTPDGLAILDHLATVTTERRRRAADTTLEQQVKAVKQYQHARFARTYADILAQPRYARAARFFLEDLYGPGDFTQRDDQFARIVPALVRLFPHDIVATVRSLSALHALSETLDTLMALAGEGLSWDSRTYARAWQAVGRPAEREQQVVLTMAVGSALDGFTRSPLLRHSLRLMRGPARATGLAALHEFLERGFDTFREMNGATAFLGTIARRERDLAERLFSATASSIDDGSAAVLSMLP